MVAGIYFMKQLLLYVFTKLLVRIRSKIVLSLAFCFSAAFLSAFLDALTVVAVIISVAMGFYGVYHKVASGKIYKMRLILPMITKSKIMKLSKNSALSYVA